MWVVCTCFGFTLLCVCVLWLCSSVHTCRYLGFACAHPFMHWFSKFNQPFWIFLFPHCGDGLQSYTVISRLVDIFKTNCYYQCHVSYPPSSINSPFFSHVLWILGDSCYMDLHPYMKHQGKCMVGFWSFFHEGDSDVTSDWFFCVA